MRFLYPLFVLFLTLALSTGASAASFTPLGDLPGRTFDSHAQGVSADGSTVVGYSQSGTSTAFGWEAFVWDATNGMQGIGILPVSVGIYFTSLAYGISADGSTVVGQSGLNSFVWDATNGMRVMDIHYPVIDNGPILARGFSADGSTVVGQAGFPDGEGSFRTEAFVWDAINGTQSIGLLPGGLTSFAYGVSADGSTVVGTAGSQAFVWDATNGMQGIGFLPGTFTSWARGVSADGSTVVGTSQGEAFVWDATNGMQGIGGGSGIGVSADGSTVVGTAGGQAFVWDAINGMQSLQLLLTSHGVDLTGWQLEEATGVSAAGNTIVGFGTNPSGDTEAFVANISAGPPAVPGLSIRGAVVVTLAMIALGFILLGGPKISEQGH